MPLTDRRPGEKRRSGILAEVQFEHFGGILRSALIPVTGEVGKEPLAHLPVRLWPRPGLWSSCPLLGMFLSIVPLHLPEPAPVLHEAFSGPLRPLSLLFSSARTDLEGDSWFGGEHNPVGGGEGWLVVLPVTLRDHGQIAAAFWVSVSSSVNWGE